MGSCPDWYVLIRAAKYLGVAPWVLQTQPAAWMDWALMAESAENEAERARLKRHSKR